MNASQYNSLMVVLHQILGRMPEPPAPVPVPQPLTVHHLDGTSTVTGGHPVRTGSPPVTVLVPAPVPAVPIKGSALVKVQRHALGVVLQALDGWVQGAKENHEAMGHRGENTGSECWRTFAPSDIRRIINDAATELGLAEFAAPTEPEEDKAL